VQLSELEAIRRDLAALLGGHAVSVRAPDRALYSRDCWPRTLLWERRGELRHLPDVVVWPSSTDDVVRLVRYARERQLPVVAFGAGSSVVAGTVPLRAGIVADFKRMRALRTDLPQRRAVAQAGIVGQRLEEALARRGATMGHFPSSIYCSTLGGWIAGRGAGQMSSHYGKIEDMVLGLTAVTGTGEVVRAGPERAPGPDLVQLVTGSEGVLALVVDATVRIHPKPQARALRGVRMKSTEAGVEAMHGIFRAGMRPHVLRLYDPVDSLVADAHGGGRRTAEQAPRGRHGRALGLALRAPGLLNRAADLVPPRCMLVVSFEGDAQARVEERLRTALDVCREAGGTDVGESPARKWYRTRYSVSYKQSGVFMSGGWSDTMEVAAVWDRVLPVLRAVREAVSPHAFCACHFSHAYLEGTSLYFTFVGPAPTPQEGERSYERCWKAGMQAALAAGATLSHHHGVGAAKAMMLPEELGDGGMRLLRALKASFDPDGILNPGKLLS